MRFDGIFWMRRSHAFKDRQNDRQIFWLRGEAPAGENYFVQ